MPGSPRVGIGLQSKDGYVTVANVIDGSPASRCIAKGDIVTAVNDVLIENGDAAQAQKAILTATHQSTTTGRMLPVRLTIGTLQLASPKGVDDLFLNMWDQEAAETASPRKHSRGRIVPTLPLQTAEVVQVL